MRIGLTFNLKSDHAPAGTADDRFEEFDSEETIAALEAAIRAAGHDPVRLGWGEAMLDRLRSTRVDGVFNLAEGIGGRGRESQVPAVLEMLGIPCSASDPIAIGITLDKALAKTLAKAHGIATAPWAVIDRGVILSREDGEGPPASIALPFPLFAKPANEGSSMGITSASVCDTPAQLDAAIERLTPYGPVLVEEFLPGEEYTVGIVGGEPIGVMQVLSNDGDERFVYSLEVKRDYERRVRYRSFRDAELEEVAMAVWRAFGLRDVARVDLRRDRDGIANFVEVNPLPGMNPVTSDLIIMAKQLGWTYDRLIAAVLDSAIARWRCAS